MKYKSSNPALSQTTFTAVARDDTAMTLSGVTTKSLFMLAIALLTGVAGWTIADNNPDLAGTLLIGGIIVTLIMAITISIKKTWAPTLALPYAALEGVVLGLLSNFYESLYDGIVVQALLATSAVFIALLLIYKSGLIHVTDNFRMGVMAATGGIFLFYIASFVLGFFNVDVPLVHENGLAGILFSVFVVGIASLNLVIDFDFIEKGVERQAPKYMEWYASFGLFITLVWLYIEILRLLGKTRR